MPSSPFCRRCSPSASSPRSGSIRPCSSGASPKPNSALDINTRFILNTFEQFILYFIGNAGLALYCPPEEARTLIILTALFLLGRVLFWVGYHYNPYMRAFGFGITFYPTVAVYLWLILRMVFGIHVRI